MKKSFRAVIAATAALCCISATALPAMAAGCDCVKAIATGCSKPVAAGCSKPVTDGSFHYTTKAKAKEKLSVKAFDKSNVTINAKTHAVNEVYDSCGNLIPATLSTDCHWYIVPTNEGYALLPTGY